VSQAGPSLPDNDREDPPLVRWSIANLPTPIEEPGAHPSVPAVPLSEDDIRRILAMALGHAPVGDPPRFLPPIIAPTRRRSLRYRRVALAIAAVLLAMAAFVVIYRRVIRPRPPDRGADAAPPAVKAVSPSPPAAPVAAEVREWVIDDADPGFRTTGAGWVASNVGGYRGAHHYNRKDARSAFWEFEGLPEGKYEVYATWHHLETRAFEAFFNVSDGDRKLRSVILNQSAMPRDIVTREAGWRRLGVFEVASGRLTIELDATQSKVRKDVLVGSSCSADAILVRSVPAGTPGADRVPGTGDGR
jgi:hypothetical protein